MLFGVKLSDLLKAWLALLMETRLMTPASLFLLEAPLPPSLTHQWIVMQCCDSISHWKITPSMKREVKMFYRYS